MKNLKISDSEKKLLMILLSVVLIAGAYFLVFQSLMSKAQEIEESNAANALIVSQLEAMVQRKDAVEEDTAECRQTVEDIIAKYPPLVTTEKAIVFIQDMEDATGSEVTATTFLMDNLIGNIAAKAASTAVVSDADTSADVSEDPLATDTAPAAASTPTGIISAGAPVGYYSTVTMSYHASYESFKAIVNYINSQEDRMTIPSITATYDDETGELTGTITVNMYYLTNTGREYEKPTVNGVSKGVTDVFRSSGVGTSVGDTNVSDENGGEENEDEGDEEENTLE